MDAVLLLVKFNGKQRLKNVYTEEQRRKLILFLFKKMLKVLEGFTVYVATPDGLSGDKFTVIRDEWGDINKVISKARCMVPEDLLILPSDLPFLERDDIDLVIGEEICIVPSQDGGTNALFLPHNTDFVTQFGEDSFEKHVKLLEEKNLEYEIYESDNFRDIDTEKDILWTLEHRKNSEFSKFVKKELVAPSSLSEYMEKT